MGADPQALLRLANLEAQSELSDATKGSIWLGSEFSWLMQLPSRSRGKAGEVIASLWLEKLGYDVRRSATAGHDRLVAGRPVEIKFSTLWESGEYVFQQLRDQDYEFVLLLGVSPDTAHAWFVPKRQAMQYSTPQHAGRRGTDTRWIRFRRDQPPNWLHPYGGELSSAIQALQAFLGLPEHRGP